MSNILHNYSLKNHNTFGVDAKAKHFASFSSEDELKDLLKDNLCQTESLFVLGGGSNILLTKDFEGIVLANKIKGINIISEGENNTNIAVGAGEVWHDFVLWSIQKNLSGIENLALIPGLVGASPMQNIGAYGVEVKDVITRVNYIEIESGNKKSFTNRECNFSYRNSIFKKKLEGKVVITEVVYKLSKTPLNNTKYGAITNELKRLKKEPSPSSIAEAVINIRSSKLPDPKTLGNSGSFFKNPIIETHEFEKLEKEFPEMVGNKISDTETKVSAGWLIDNAELKGYRKADAGVHKNHALVLVNYGDATGLELINLAKEIQQKIKDKYGISIETEVNIL
ncbi:UDP-N-acetylmuramate dehydrogenase [Flavobacteriales bacterium]|nr:UDP-N-acetylmuramate dehydrogenase [Flavobacteriales bacterium]